MTQHVDAAIVGGGPAGAILARRLALKSWRVMLIERGVRFRPKTCGHCLAPRALPMLNDEVLLAIAERLAVGCTRGLRVHAAGGRRCVTAALGESEHDAGLLVRRDHFDQALRDAAAEAGANVVQPASARMVENVSSTATLRVTTTTQTFEVRCGLLIGADGLGSAVARAAGLVDRHATGRKYGFSLTIPPRGERAALHEGSIEMFLLGCGYIGAVMQADGHVHLAALVKAADRASASPAEVLTIAASSHPAFAQLLRDTSISEMLGRAIAAGPMPWRTRAIASGRIALVGDAAGYVEPFTGEGMTWAIESAGMLARSIECSGGAWNRDAADMYARMWNARIAGAQRMCRWISAGLERPMLSRMLHRVAARVPSLTEQLVRRAVAA